MRFGFSAVALSGVKVRASKVQDVSEGDSQGLG